jgi:hypothetical protein
MAYSSDLKPQEYELIQPYLPKKLQTKKREISYHSILYPFHNQLLHRILTHPKAQILKQGFAIIIITSKILFNGSPHVFYRV